MRLWTSNAIITKAKSIYGNRLKQQDYETLVKFKSVADVVSYLQNKPYYKDYLRDAQAQSIHRGQLEAIIRKVIFMNTLKIVQFVNTSDNSFYTLNMVQSEIDIILSVIRSVISDESDTTLKNYPSYFKKHASYDMDKLTVSKTFNDVLEAVMDTRYYAVLAPFNVARKELIKYADIEHALDLLFYDVVFSRINKLYSGKRKKELELIYQTKIELNNIIKIYRLKKFYYADRETILDSLNLKYSRMKEKKLEEIIALTDADLILHYLERSEYARYMDDQEYIFVEYYAEHMKYNLAKRYMYFSNDAPKVYSAFSILIEIERDNLFNIIEGIRYELEEDEIRKMLIY